MPIRVSTTSGILLDVVSLVEDSLEYQTGEAEDLFSQVQAASGMDGADLYDFMRNWSNGYVIAKEGSASWAEKAALS